MIRTVSGSSDTPLRDGTMRGAIGFALVGILNVVNHKMDWLTDSDVADLSGVIVLLSFVLAGVWDRYVKPKLGTPS